MYADIFPFSVFPYSGSALIYYTVLTWDADGTIVLGKGQWANLGAEGSHLLAQLFGEYGLDRIFHEHPGFAIFSVGCLVVGIAGPVLRRLVPKRWRFLAPNTVLIGLAQFPPANAFSVITGLSFGILCQWYLKTRHSKWYTRNQVRYSTWELFVDLFATCPTQGLNMYGHLL